MLCLRLMLSHEGIFVINKDCTFVSFGPCLMARFVNEYQRENIQRQRQYKRSFDRITTGNIKDKIPKKLEKKPMDLFSFLKKPLDGLLFEMRFFSRWDSFRDGILFATTYSRGGLLFKMIAENIKSDYFKTMSKTTTQIFQPQNLL